MAAAGALALAAGTFVVGTTMAVASDAVASLFASPVVVDPALQNSSTRVAQQAAPPIESFESNIPLRPINTRRPTIFDEQVP